MRGNSAAGRGQCGWSCSNIIFQIGEYSSGGSSVIMPIKNSRTTIRSGRSIWAEARRKTTQKERKEIAEYCIAHDKDYKGTAVLYDVSYGQVYTWVKKYLAAGENGLADKRGHHKSDDEVDELERLRRENLRLKRKLEEQSMVVELLKKVKELEGK